MPTRPALSIAIAFALLTPAGAHAGAGIVGKCSLSGGAMATSGEVNAMQQGLIAEILEVTRALNSGQIRQIKAQQNLLNELAQAESAHQKDLAAAEARARYLNNTLGIQAQPAGGCERPSEAVARAEGEAVAGLLSSHYLEEMVDHNTGGTDRRAARIEAAKRPADTGALYTGAGGPDAVESTVKGLTAPEPPLAYLPPEGKKPPPAGTQHIAEHRAWSARMQVAQAALAMIGARHTPTLEAAPAKTAWARAGNEGPAPGLSPDGQRISLAGELDVQVAHYRDDPNWQASLAVANRAGVLRHLTHAGMVSAHQSLVSLETVQHLVSVTAVEYAQRLGDDVEAITQSAREVKAQ